MSCHQILSKIETHWFYQYLSLKKHRLVFRCLRFDCWLKTGHENDQIRLLLYAEVTVLPFSRAVKQSVEHLHIWTKIMPAPFGKGTMWCKDTLGHGLKPGRGSEGYYVYQTIREGLPEKRYLCQAEVCKRLGLLNWSISRGRGKCRTDAQRSTFEGYSSEKFGKWI